MEREDEEDDDLPIGGGIPFGCVCDNTVRCPDIDKSTAGAITRLTAAAAAAPAAEVCEDKFANGWDLEVDLEAVTLEHVWSAGKRCCGQNCCLHCYFTTR